MRSSTVASQRRVMSAFEILCRLVFTDAKTVFSLPVFCKDLLDQIKVQLGLRHHGLKVDPSLVFLLKDDVWRSLVHPDAKALQFLLQDLLVTKGLEHVQHNEDDVCCSGDSNNLYRYLVKIFDKLTFPPVFLDPCHPLLLQWFQEGQEAEFLLPGSI